MHILFVYIYATRSIRVRDVGAPSLVRINIDSLVVLVSGKFPCFYFVHFKLQVGNQIGKDLFHAQCNVYPNLKPKEQTHLSNS